MKTIRIPLSILSAVLLSFFVACQSDVVEPVEPSVLEQILGKWNLEQYTTETCQISTDDCDMRSIPLEHPDFFEFTEDNVTYQILGGEATYPLKVISKDTLEFSGHRVSEYFIITRLADDQLDLIFYMDHSSPLVHDDYNLTDFFYLKKVD